jgi:hypothetical protein
MSSVVALCEEWESQGHPVALVRITPLSLAGKVLTRTYYKEHLSTLFASTAYDSPTAKPHCNLLRVLTPDAPGVFTFVESWTGSLEWLMAVSASSKKK